MQLSKQDIFEFLRRNPLGKSIVNFFFIIKYRGSTSYWQKRYRAQGNSGNGSYGELANFKASVINDFIAENNIQKAIEFGCGDGNQLKQFKVGAYTGLDVSLETIEKNKGLFKQDQSKHFYSISYWEKNKEQLSGNDLALSLDVIYHLVENKIFEYYMHSLFSASGKFVIIYAWDIEQQQLFHIKHRKFSQWINAHKPEWKLIKKIENPGLPESCDFFIYQKKINT